MLQFLTYLLHKQIIEMRHSQNLRCPFLVHRVCVRVRVAFLDLQGAIATLHVFKQ